jgi:hypothetical protein
MESTLTFTVRPEVEQIASEQHISVEAVMNEAITTYLQTYAERKLRERLETDYRALSDVWPELSADLANDQWLPVENDALDKFEKSLD